MSRIIAIDYGTKRCGIAVTDELQIIATALETVQNDKLLEYLSRYIAENNVQEIVIGLPVRMHGEVGELEKDIQQFIQKFQKAHPNIPVFRENEMFTSKLAAQTIFHSGLKKKKRQDKALIDKVSATIILQSYMSSKNN